MVNRSHSSRPRILSAGTTSKVLIGIGSTTATQGNLRAVGENLQCGLYVAFFRHRHKMRCKGIKISALVQARYINIERKFRKSSIFLRMVENF